MQDTPTFGIAVFSNAKATAPREQRFTLDELTALLTTHRQQPDKDGELFSPAEYGPAKYRKAKNVAAVTCLVFDVDAGVGYAKVTADWSFFYIVYSTFSHTTGYPRYRLVVPLTRPVPAEEWKPLYRRATVALAGGFADPSCVDPSRMFYLPAAPADTWEQRVTFVNPGDLLDPDTIPAPAAKQVEAAEKRQREALPAGAKGDYRTLDVVGLFEDLGLYGELKDADERKHAVRCPHAYLHSEQRDATFGDTVIWESEGEGWPGFYCSHAHCDGLTLLDVIKENTAAADARCAREWTKPADGVNIPALLSPITAVLEDADADPLSLFDHLPALLAVERASVGIYRKTLAQIGQRFPRFDLKDFTDALKQEKDREKPPKAIRSGDDPITGREPTAYGNALRLIDKHGEDVRYCHEFHKWYRWNGVSWERDDTEQMMQLAAGIAYDLRLEAATMRDRQRQQEFDSHIRRTETPAGFRGLLELAQAHVPITPRQMDRDPLLLTCINGTVDLRTGDLRESRREDFITRTIPVSFDPAATCPKWLSFLADVFDGDADLIAFIQKAVGYSLTAEVLERVIFILWGRGKNGKSTLIETIAALLDSYAVTLPVESLLSTERDGGVPNDIALLKGARFCFTAESDEGKRLAEGKVKALTGNDTMKARFMRGEWFSFEPTHKLWLATNHRPVIQGSDDGIWDRIRLIPFTVRFSDDPVERARGAKPLNKGLKRELIAELPGILAWAVEGARRWLDEGLEPPQAVHTATAGYRQAMDQIGLYLTERCFVDPTARVSVARQYEDYRAWCEDAGERALTKKMFGIRMQDRGFDTQPDGRVTWRYGVGLVADTPTTSSPAPVPVPVAVTSSTEDCDDILA